MRSLTQLNFFQAEYKRAVWLAYADPALAPADLLAAPYWSHVANQLKAFDRVEVLSEDAAWWAEYIVLEVGHNWAKLSLLREHSLVAATKASTVPVQAYDDHEIKYRGVRKWSVLRKGDNTVLKENLEKTRRRRRLARRPPENPGGVRPWRPPGSSSTTRR